jgi:hypothetical protein
MQHAINWQREGGSPRAQLKCNNSKIKLLFSPSSSGSERKMLFLNEKSFPKSLKFLLSSKLQLVGSEESSRLAEDKTVR